MNTSTSEHWMSNTQTDNSTQSIYLLLALAVPLVYLANFLFSRAGDPFPYFNPPKRLDFLAIQSKKFFLGHARGLLRDGKAKYPGRPFRMMTTEGDIVMLPAQFSQEIRNEPGLDMMQAVADRFHAHLPGFEPFRAGSTADQLVQKVVRKQLTKMLNKVTEPLSSETSYAAELAYGSSPEWHEISFQPTILDFVARLSSRVFLGPEVCRNEAWLAITKSYTVHGMIAATQLRFFPKWLRGIAHIFLPECRLIRTQVAEARSIIGPVIEKRREARRAALEAGSPLPSFDDALDWAEDESQGRPYDADGVQLGLSFAAIHTTTDLMTKTMLRIAGDPALVEELRQEIVRVLAAEGWKKTALYNLKLLDSVIKETMRIDPVVGMATMGRVATQPVTLPDGQILKRGEFVKVDTSEMYNPEAYPDPATFDPYRFSRMRGQPGQDKNAHLVSIGPSFLGFGLGEHACPGRFFAANEVKVGLVHLLMKYDWRLASERETFVKDMGFSRVVEGDVRVLVRKREAEMDIDAV